MSFLNRVPQTFSSMKFASNLEVRMLRALSWLDFNQRVLAQAFDNTLPLFERFNFLQIADSNLHEFFRKDFSLLSADRFHQPVPYESMLQKVKKIYALRDGCWTSELKPLLQEEGVFLLTWNELNRLEKSQVRKYLLAKQTGLKLLRSSHGHFPIGSLPSTQPVVLAEVVENATALLVALFAETAIAPWITTQPTRRKPFCAVATHSALEALLPECLPKGSAVNSVLSCRLFRTIHGKAEGDLKGEDPVEAGKKMLQRRKYLPFVAAEFSGKRFLERNWGEEFVPDHAFHVRDLLPAISISQFSKIIKKGGLRFERWHPVRPEFLAGTSEESMFTVLAKGDVLVSHPFESFSQSVERFMSDASKDPAVKRIYMTAYRLGERSPFVRLLIDAAHLGKDVHCLIELGARFDEARNIAIAENLKEAGVTVSFGVPDYKTHAKVILVEREEHGLSRWFSHVSTGNYHAETSELYTDVGLFTCDDELTKELLSLWKVLTNRPAENNPQQILLAPFGMRERFLKYIEAEKQAVLKGQVGHIIAKMNTFDDQELSFALFDAAEHGVRIELLVRGACVLPFSSHDNIRVVSVVGRLLEHSRIFYFRSGAPSATLGAFFIGSPDWMKRNLDTRFELVVPIRRWGLKEKLWEILQLGLHDKKQAWERNQEGVYERLRPGALQIGVCSQRALMKRAKVLELRESNIGREVSA